MSEVQIIPITCIRYIEVKISALVLLKKDLKFFIRDRNTFLKKCVKVVMKEPVPIFSE